MSVASIAAAAQSALPGAGPRDVTLDYGLSFRFTVQIDGIELGEWHSCTGLKVDFKPVATKSGGSYTGASHLPGEFVYAKVVLKRAAKVADSREVQKWLAKHARDWGASEAQSTAGDTGLIVVYDSVDQPVVWWRLRDVHPSAWSGPDLSATTSKVALETLELVHGGFEVGTGAPPSDTPEQGTRTPPLTLTDAHDETSAVTFDLPPTEIVVARRQKGSGAGGTSSSRATATSGARARAGDDASDDTPIRPNQTTYKVSNLVLRGRDTKRYVDLLTVWSTNTNADTRGSPILPPLTLSWGDGFSNVPVFLEAMTATYTRFSPQGIPVRAKIGLTLGVAPADPASASGTAHSGATNPTSGGIPGRAAHTLLQGDSLTALAQRTYGDAARWRAIAEANGVDDPLRVRPGRSLLLPAPVEVGP